MLSTVCPCFQDRRRVVHTLQIIVIAVRIITRLPIAIIPRTPVDAGNPGPVPIVVSAIAIWVVMPSVVIWVVMASIVIWVIPSTVIISRSWRRNKAGNTEHRRKH
jgi:hypothetical protein